MDKDSRKRLKRQLREQQRDAALRALPLPVSELELMFEAVHSDVERLGCDKTRRFTESWLGGRGHDIATVVAWLDEHSGFCDCEVLTNARQHFFEAKQGSPTASN